MAREGEMRNKENITRMCRLLWHIASKNRTIHSHFLASGKALNIHKAIASSTCIVNHVVSFSSIQKQSIVDQTENGDHNRNTPRS